MRANAVVEVNPVDYVVERMEKSWNPLQHECAGSVNKAERLLGRYVSDLYKLNDDERLSILEKIEAESLKAMNLADKGYSFWYNLNKSVSKAIAIDKSITKEDAKQIEDIMRGYRALILKWRADASALKGFTKNV